MFLKPILALLLVALPALAQAESSTCASWSSYREVLKCAVERHPTAVQAQLLFEQNKNLIGIAEQRPNPEINSQFLQGENGSEKYRYSQINLAHTFETGGKRGARIDRAKAESKTSRINFKFSQEEVYVKTYLGMVRLRQISDELEVYDDALTTFAKIQKQYRSRPRMTPEQKATFAIMDIAANDYRIRRHPLVNEARHIERFLELAIGRKLDVRKDFYPALRKQWPSIAEKSISDLASSPEVQRSLAELEIAKAELAQAKAVSWPDIKLGPTFEQQQTGAQNSSALGVNLTFNIPLFHLNGSGRDYANAGVSRGEAAVASTKSIEAHEWELQRSIYNDAVASIQQSLTTTQLHQRHREVESSFATGIIPSSLVIEIHRQMADYSKSLGDQETTAIEALAKIYSIENRLLSEGL